ncbi:hypothetical protein [uncultured Ilyobacter sp.]|nr:hypothetical protein [uncultured Ilyobacter sp.]
MENQIKLLGAMFPCGSIYLYDLAFSDFKRYNLTTRKFYYRREVIL